MQPIDIGNHPPCLVGSNLYDIFSTLKRDIKFRNISLQDVRLALLYNDQRAQHLPIMNGFQVTHPFFGIRIAVNDDI